MAPPWAWWKVAGVTCLLLHPYVTVHFLRGLGEDRQVVAGQVCVLLADLAVLCAALFLAIDARLVACTLRASMAAAATIVVVQDAPLALLAVVDPALGAPTYRLSLGHLLVTLVVLATVTLGAAEVFPRRVHPLLAGLVLGGLCLGSSIALQRIAGDSFVLHADHPTAVAMMAMIVCCLAAIWVTLLRSELPVWVVTRIGLGMLAIFVARLASTLADADEPLPVVVVGFAVFSALIMTTSFALLRSSLTDGVVTSRAFATRAALAEAAVRHDQETAHEVRAATAGIVAGAHLLASGRVPPGPRRSALEKMVDTEAARLSRTLAPPRVPPTLVALDDVIGPLLVAQEALGHDVAWEGCGLSVLARPDDIAEVMNILLNNAARHGLRRGTRVSCLRDGSTVDIRVSDRGPGIAPEVRERLFQWGARGPASPGQGIGLQRARRLVRQYGGQLVVEQPVGEPGAVFVVRLPAEDEPSGPDRRHPVTGLVL